MLHRETVAPQLVKTLEKLMQSKEIDLSFEPKSYNGLRWEDVKKKIESCFNTFLREEMP